MLEIAEFQSFLGPDILRNILCVLDWLLIKTKEFVICYYGKLKNSRNALE